MSTIIKKLQNYENPLLKGTKMINIDNEEIYINNINAKKYFNNIIYCCVIDKTKNNNYYIKTLIDEKEYNSIINNFVIFKIDNMDIIMNPYFSSIMKVVSKKDISIFNKLNIPLNNYNLVINFTNIDYNNINNFIKIFEEKLSIKDFINNIYLADYYKINNKIFMNKLEDMLKKLNGYNSNIVIRNKIKARKTNFYTGDITINSCNYIANNTSHKDTILSLTKYFYENKNECFVLFISYLLSNNYYISSLLKSKYVLNILNRMKLLIRVSITKAFKILYNNELLMDTSIKQNDEIVFNINEASLLPSYGNNFANPYNIYNDKIGFNIGKYEMQKIDYVSALSIQLGIKTKNRIANLIDFKKQMNVFISRDVNINFFQNIDLCKYNATIVGSIIPACSIVNHPLMYHFMDMNIKYGKPEYWKKLDRFYAEYYPDSDIDIMLYNKNIFNYIINANNFMNKLVLECARKQNKINNIKNYKIKKKICIRIILTKNIIEKKFKNILINDIKKYKSLSLYSILKMNNTEKKQATNIYNIIYNLFVSNYSSLYKNQYNKLSDEEKKNVNNSNLIEFQDIKNIISNDNIDIEFNIRIFSKFNICWSWKYSIESVYLSHNFEIFYSREKEPFSLVSKFHLNCVKGYYTKIDCKEDNVFLLPSCIIALQSFYNISMSYFHGKTNKYEIINKYRMRGFGTILNKTDIKNIKKFIKENKFWKNLYGPKLNLDNKLYLGDILFQPRLRNIDAYNTSKYFLDSFYQDLYHNKNMLLFSKK